jgi:hypothetical protein
MAELMRDPIWQFVGVTLAAIAIIVAIWLSLREHNLKRLAYFIHSTLLLSVSDELRDNLKILYNDKPVEDVRLCEFGIKNIGNVPILPTDFIRPVELFLGAKSHVLTADVLSTTPPDLGAKIQWWSGKQTIEAATSVVIAPLLLNQGDAVSIKCLVTGSEVFDVRGRIVGVKEIVPESQPRSRKFLFISLPAGFCLGILSMFASAWLYERSKLLSYYFISLGLVVPLVAISWVVVRRLKLRSTLSGRKPG